MEHVPSHRWASGLIRSNPRVRHAAEASLWLDCSLVVSVPRLGLGDDRALAVLREPHGRPAGAFRRVASALATSEDPPRVVSITSATSNEGRTTVAVATALALAASGRRTLLVDADLHGPGVAQLTGLEGIAGLTTILLGKASFDEVIQPWQVPGLDVLTSGDVPPNPSTLLSSDALTGLLRQLGGGYDSVIIDAPPILPPGSPAQLSGAATATLVVVRVGHSRLRDVGTAARALSQAGVTPVGLVLTGVPHDQHLAQPDVRRRLSRPERTRRRPA